MLFGNSSVQATDKIVHDTEYYILQAQNGEKWTAEDKEVDKKLADLQKKYGGPATSSMRPPFLPRLPGWPAPPSTFPPIASSTASTRQPC